MKKITLFLVALFCAGGAFAASYGILVNGNTYFAGTLNSNAIDPNYTEYMALGVPVKSGDYLQLYDKDNAAAWAVALNTASTAGITYSSDRYNCTADGCYDFYIKLKYEADELYIGSATGDCSSNTGENLGGGTSGGGGTGGGGSTGGETGSYTSSVPSQCPDVMLQAFYWDSNNDKGFGDTKWTTLNSQASEISAYFDLVWLPPSAKSSGGVGYIPLQYSNQTGAWGTRAELEKFIAAMHAGNTKVIADIVINHCGNKSSWCDYYTLDFGEYGQFSPDASWITRDDEVWSSGQAGCTVGSGASYDDGQGDPKGYGAARDWDHNNAQVREMCCAYLKWMKNEMHYDGWRYDYCKGFHESHINDYNSASQADFSVMEWWDGNANTLKAAIGRSSNNTLTFDFATKYSVFDNGLAKQNYQIKGQGLLGAGYSKYAVTFIDSHDTFGRSDASDIMGKNDGSSINNKSLVLQCNAYILSMPGIPCVFYPHWYTFKSEIAPMILARKAVGVHSESSVSDEASGSGYRATVTGKNGTLILELGDKVSSAQSGYTKAASGDGYAMWIKTNQAVAPKLVVTPASTTFKTETLKIEMKTIGGTETAEIYYTIDGTNPKTSATRIAAGSEVSFTIDNTITLKAYAKTKSTETTVQTYEYTRKEPQTTPIVVSFYKPASWTDVYLYSWTGSGASVTTQTGKWPGTKLTETNADGFHFYQFDAAVKEVNFIFNAGKDKDQTSDLWTDEDVCYMWDGGAEKKLPDCKVTAIGNVWADHAETISLWPNPALGTLHLSSSENLSRIDIYTCTGTLVESVSANASSTTMDVNGLQQGLYLLRATLANGQTTVGKFVKQ